MIELVSQAIPQFELFVLMFMRISGLFFIVPIFGARNVPTIFRIGLGLLITFLLFQFYNLPPNLEIDSFLEIGFVALSELVIGLLLGYISLLAFSSLIMAGQIIDTHLGFGIVSLFDPQSGMEVSTLGRFYNILSMIIFFSINGHHTLILLLIRTFDIIPLGDFRIDFNVFYSLVGVFIYFFLFAFIFSIPIIAAVIMIEVIFGIIVRTLPQMNIFVLGIPIKIVLGLLAIYLLMPIYSGVKVNMFDEMFTIMQSIIEGIALN